MEPVELRAESVRLRPHQDDDLDAMVAQCSDPESQRWTTLPSPYSLEHAERFLDLTRRGWADGNLLALAIADPATDAFLGTVDARPDSGRGASVGFGLVPQARGRGVMTAALRVFADWVLDAGGLDRDVLRWEAIIGNWASRRVAWKAGFRIEGTVRGLAAQRGEQRDGWIGSLRRTDRREPPHPWYAARELVGERVRLRPLRDADAAACVEACSDPVTRHWLSGLPDPYTKEAALGYIHSREEEHASGRGVYWCAADPASDACLGTLGVMGVESDVGTAEIGYWMHPAARSRGVASEAVRLVAAHVLGPAESGGLGLRRVELQTAAGNVASQHVARNAGFTRTGLRRAAERLGDGSYDDLLVFDRLATDQTPA
ncbi:MAG: GNAT family N-acetyltransferase [Streptosporangiales bacterium]